MVLRGAGPLGRGRAPNTFTPTRWALTSTVCSCSLALLAGLAVGKAWERYKLQDGRWIDRRRARESPHYMLGLNFLVANQIDPAIEELKHGGRGRRRPARDPPDSRQPVPREGTGRARDPGASEPAPAAASAEARARQRAALPRARLQARRLRRPRARGVHGGAAGSTPATSTRCRTSRSCTRSSISGPRRMRCARSSRRATAPTTQPRHQEILAFLENEIGLEAHEADQLPRRPPGDSRRRSISMRRTRPRYLNLGDVRFRRATSADAIDDVGAADRRPRPIARTWRSPASKARIRKLSDAGAVSRALPPADRGQPPGLAGPARAGALSDRTRSARRRARAALRSARASIPHALALHQAIWQTLSTAEARRRRSSSATPISPATPSSTSIRTSASAAATAARSCSGSARTATNGTRSSRNASRRRRTRRRRSPAEMLNVECSTSQRPPVPITSDRIAAGPGGAARPTRVDDRHSTSASAFSIQQFINRLDLAVRLGESWRRS